MIIFVNMKSGYEYPIRFWSQFGPNDETQASPLPFHNYALQLVGVSHKNLTECNYSFG